VKHYCRAGQMADSSTLLAHRMSDFMSSRVCVRLGDVQRSKGSLDTIQVHFVWDTVVFCCRRW